MDERDRETETARETYRHREREIAERDTGLEVLGKKVRAAIKRAAIKKLKNNKLDGKLKYNKAEEKDNRPILAQKPRCLE